MTCAIQVKPNRPLWHGQVRLVNLLRSYRVNAFSPIFKEGRPSCMMNLREDFTVSQLTTRGWTHLGDPVYGSIMFVGRFRLTPCCAAAATGEVNWIKLHSPCGSGQYLHGRTLWASFSCGSACYVFQFALAKLELFRGRSIFLLPTHFIDSSSSSQSSRFICSHLHSLFRI